MPRMNVNLRPATLHFDDGESPIVSGLAHFGETMSKLPMEMAQLRMQQQKMQDDRDQFGAMNQLRMDQFQPYDEFNTPDGRSGTLQRHTGDVKWLDGGAGGAGGAPAAAPSDAKLPSMGEPNNAHNLPNRITAAREGMQEQQGKSMLTGATNSAQNREESDVERTLHQTDLTGVDDHRLAALHAAVEAHHNGDPNALADYLTKDRDMAQRLAKTRALMTQPKEEEPESFAPHYDGE